MKNRAKITIMLLFLITILSTNIVSIISSTNSSLIYSLQEKTMIEYYTNVEINKMIVYYAGDGMHDPGEIYCKCTVNNVKYKTRIIPQVNNNEIITYEETIYSDWTSYLNIQIDIFDEDVSEYTLGNDDLLDSFTTSLAPTNVTLTNILEHCLLNITISTSDITTVTISVDIIPLAFISLFFVTAILFFRKENTD